MQSLRTNASSLAAALILAMSVARPASADGGSSVRAQALFEQGVKLLELGAWADACAKLSESNELDPAGGTSLDIGFCEEKQGHLASALAAYEDARRRAAEDGRADRERLAQQEIDALARRASRVHVQLAPAVSSLPGLVVAIDGVALAEASRSAAVPVNPGKRTIVVRATGRRALVRDVWIAGEAALIELHVEALDDAARAIPAPALGPTAHAAALPPSAPPSSAASGRRPLGLALGGGGLALLATGIATGVAAANEHAESNRECPAGACTQAGVDAEDRAHRLAWVSNGGFIVGGLLVAVGTYVFSSAPRPSAIRSARPTPRGFTVAF